MKFRNREFNVFSMSALDLFASALGAFILISIVLMPYFLRPPPKVTPTFPTLDIVMALDTTGSMRQQVAGLRSEIAQFTQVLLKLSPSVAVGVIDYKDRCEGRNAVRVFPLRRMTPAGMNGIVSFTRTMRAGGSRCNRDTPEALAAALDAAIASNWRSESDTKVIVVITDAPAYPHRQAHTLNAARAFASRGGEYKVSVVLRGRDKPFLRRLARAGRGEYVRAGASFATTVLLALMR